MSVLFARIPEDRVGALIGPGGRTKSEIERLSSARVQIDPSDGSVEVDAADTADPVLALKARDVVVAIGRGFSPERAFRLWQDETYLGLIDIKRVTGRREKAAMWRIRSRLIGTEGRARTRIEELSGASMSIYGNSVALIGKAEQIERATRAVELLLRGSEHSVVFRLLAHLRREAAIEEALGSEDAVD